jgi:ABC-type nitrate/sulfonate/bicarbonate transport system ATPase subunit
MEIIFKNVTKSFKEFSSHSNKVVVNLNFAFSKPGIYCIKGKSGIGKTTILNLISGLIKPDSGTVIIRPSRALGYSFDEDLLLPWLDVEENLLLSLSSNKISSREWNLRHILRQLKYFHLESKLNSFPNQLSRGQRQRVNIIRCFLQKPSIVLLDEPFSYLDQTNRGLLEKFIIEYYKKYKAIIVIVTHQIPTRLGVAANTFILRSYPNSKLIPLNT